MFRRLALSKRRCIASLDERMWIMETASSPILPDPMSALDFDMYLVSRAPEATVFNNRVDCSSSLDREFGNQ